MSEVERVLSQPDIATRLGLRDRAVLEVLYSTGIRRMEVVRLQVDDVDADRVVLFIRQGKGKKDRVVSIGERALQWVGKYLADVRPRQPEHDPDLHRGQHHAASPRLRHAPSGGKARCR